MKTARTQNFIATALAGTLVFNTTIALAADPLPSWNDGKARESIVAFVEKVTNPGTPDFVLGKGTRLDGREHE